MLLGGDEGAQGRSLCMPQPGSLFLTICVLGRDSLTLRPCRPHLCRGSLPEEGGMTRGIVDAFGLTLQSRDPETPSDILRIYPLNK